MRRILFKVFVEEAFRGCIVVHADKVGWTRILQKESQCTFCNSRADKVFPQRVTAVNLSAKEVPRQPAAMIFEIGLILQPRRAEDLRKVLRLHEPGLWVDLPDLLHR